MDQHRRDSLSPGGDRGGVGAVAPALALTAVMFPLRSHLSVATPALVLVIPVVISVAIGGLAAGIAAAGTGFLLYDLVFIPPTTPSPWRVSLESAVVAPGAVRASRRRRSRPLTFGFSVANCALSRFSAANCAQLKGQVLQKKAGPDQTQPRRGRPGCWRRLGEPGQPAAPRSPPAPAPRTHATAPPCPLLQPP